MAASTSNSAALILVDCQEDFCEPAGSLAVPGGRSLAPVWNNFLARGSFGVRVATHDWHPASHISLASQHPGAQPFRSTLAIANPENPHERIETTLWPAHCIAGTQGASLIPELDQRYITHRVYKGQDARVECYSAFGPPFRKPRMAGSELDKILSDNKVSTVWVVGLAYDYCVKATALDAAELGYRVTVVEGATKAVDDSKENIEAVRKELRKAGVTVLPTGEEVPGCLPL